MCRFSFSSGVPSVGPSTCSWIMLFWSGHIQTWQSMHRFILVQLSWPGVLLNFYASFELKINSNKQVMIQMENDWNTVVHSHDSHFGWTRPICGCRQCFKPCLNRKLFQIHLLEQGQRKKFHFSVHKFRDWLSFFIKIPSFDSAVQKALMSSHDYFSDFTEGK